MSIDEITVPAEPISAATRSELEAMRDAARRRRQRADAAWRTAEQDMQDERRIYDVIGWLLRSGPAHVFSPAILGRRRSFLTYCRHCRASASSLAGSQSCPSDTHQCPWSVRPGECGAAVRVYERDDPVCRQPGKMIADFTAWICLLGHVTDGSHAQNDVGHVLARCVPATCPWPDLIGSPARIY